MSKLNYINFSLALLPNVGPECPQNRRGYRAPDTIEGDSIARLRERASGHRTDREITGKGDNNARGREGVRDRGNLLQCLGIVLRWPK